MKKRIVPAMVVVALGAVPVVTRATPSPRRAIRPELARVLAAAEPNERHVVIVSGGTAAIVEKAVESAGLTVVETATRVGVVTALGTAGGLIG